MRRFEKRIYIPLPEVQARRRMFELNIGDTPNDLSPADFTTLAQQTEGYSGSDIAVIVRDALMQPVRRVLAATHFRPVRRHRELPLFACATRCASADTQITVDTPEGPVEKLTPCSPGHPDAVEKAWTEVDSNQLHEPRLDVKDFEKSIEVNRPTVTLADIQKHIEFTNESGECGKACDLAVRLAGLSRREAQPGEREWVRKVRLTSRW
jgi:vacuolar protein-sorting-associated protein 4